MGRLEKIVVFTVLFLVAVILGVSLSTDPATGSPNELLADGRGANAAASNSGGPNGGKTPAERRAAREAAQRNAPEGVMSTSLADRSANNAAPVGAVPVGSVPAEAVPADAGTPVAPSNGAAPTSPVGANAPLDPASRTAPVTPTVQAPVQSGSYLVSREGLTATASDEFMIYTWQAGDTFAALAQRFYGSPLHVKRIRDANEGRDEAKLAAGESLLICALPTAESDRIARPSARDAKSSAVATVVGGTYTVGAGDVLGTISQKVYGSASKWRKIYDANRDVIGSDPNQLKPGMMLRIPQ